MKNLLHFIEHSLIAGAQVLILTLVTIALHYVVMLADVTGNPFVIYCLKGVEYLIFIFDIIFLIVISFKSLKNFIKDVWKS